MWASNSKTVRSGTSITTLIAQGTVIQGNVNFTGGLHVDGRIEGAVRAEGSDATLTLSENGSVQGEVHVPNAVINGNVVGDLHIANRLELANAARVEGNIHYCVLEMNAGAQINGKMIFRSEPQRRLSAPGVEQPDERDAETATESV
ncbi:MAG: polymer-forming cytoskeletal protein [Dokdonella sp.]